jgi:hypothetical protein
MKFKKSRNTRYKMDRTTADIMAGKQMILDAKKGIEMPIEHYDKISDKLCGKPSRNLYGKETNV